MSWERILKKSTSLSLQIHSANSIAIVRFEDGADYPRLTQETVQTLRLLMNEVERKGAFCGVVIMANEQSFAIGADIGEVSGISGAAAREFGRLGQKLCQQIADSTLPVVAAIRGFCLGGGLDLALACHARVASFDSSFGHPGAALGLVTGWGGTQRLSRLIGKGQALYMLVTGDRIPATQALTMGLVDELVAAHDLEAAAVRLCEKLAQRMRKGEA